MSEVDALIRKSRLARVKKKKQEQDSLINSKIGSVNEKADYAVKTSKEAKTIAESSVELSKKALEISKTTSKLKGEKGDTPVKGIDYFTKEEIDKVKSELRPIKGKDYFDGKDGKDGYTPIKGIDYFNGKDGKDGKNGKDGKDGKDGSPDTKYNIRDKLADLSGEERLDAKHIKNIDKQIRMTVTQSGVGGIKEETDPIYEADKPNIVFSYNGDTTLEYTNGDITKITKVVDGEVKINEYVYVYTDGNLTKLTKTVDGVDYEKVFTYTNNILTNISAWSIV